jgi:hypothetical protein
MWDHENNEMFKQAHDEQLLLWLHRSVYVYKDEDITQNNADIFAAVCSRSISSSH